MRVGDFCVECIGKGEEKIQLMYFHFCVIYYEYAIQENQQVNKQVYCILDFLFKLQNFQDKK